MQNQIIQQEINVTNTDALKSEIEIIEERKDQVGFKIPIFSSESPPEI